MTALCSLLGIELPVIQAPMAGAQLSALATAVSNAGGLGSLPCAMLSADQARNELGIIRQRTSRPINVNFFCHRPPVASPAREAAWKTRLHGYYIPSSVSIPRRPPAARAARRSTTPCATWSWR